MCYQTTQELKRSLRVDTAGVRNRGQKILKRLYRDLTS